MEGGMIFLLAWQGNKIANFFKSIEGIRTDIASMKAVLEGIDESLLSEDEQKALAGMKQDIANLEELTK
jgi:hypothetical protein